MNDKIKYTYKEMQELLPDYAFNRISEEERHVFERTLTDYLDIQKEVEDVRAVFHKVERMNFNDKYKQKTRNLSVKVQTRMNKESLISPYFKIARYLVPIGGLMVLAIIIFGDGIFSRNQEEKVDFTNKNTKPLFEIHPRTANLIMDNGLSDSEFIELTNSIKMSMPHNYIAGVADDYFAEDVSISDIINDILIEMIDSNKSIPNFAYNTAYSSITDFLEIMSEDEFQILLKEIEDEEFISGL